MTGIPFNIVFTILYFVQEENLFYNRHQTNDQGEHANPYTTDANVEAWGAESTIYCTLAEHANPYTTDAVQTRLNKSYKYHHQFV